MHATYAFNPKLQVFIYLDATKFGLAGCKDLSGTPQAGLAYAVDKSTQILLSYKYPIVYKAGGNSRRYEPQHMIPTWGCATYSTETRLTVVKAARLRNYGI